MAPFVNWSDWLALNQGDGQRMADALARNVEGQGATAQGNLAAAQSDFAKQREAGTLTYDPTASREVAKDRSDDVYGGPSQLSDVTGWADYFRQAGDAQQAANMLGSQGGRAQALQTQYGPGGASWLDSALAGAAGGERLRQTQAQYGALQQAFGTADANAQGEAKKAREATATAAGQYGALANAPMPKTRPKAPGSMALDDRLERAAELRRERRTNGSSGFGRF